MASIRYAEGDATYPEGEGLKLIVHVCNDIGGWGAGFVRAISKRWKEPEYKYRRWHGLWADEYRVLPFEVGMIQPVKVASDITVINMIAQNGVVSPSNPKPINYRALWRCLNKVANYAEKHSGENPSVHMPRIGCGLAGGDWEEVEAIIEKTLVDRHVDVVVYDLP